MSLLDDQLSEFQAGHKLDAYTVEAREKSPDAFELNSFVRAHIENSFRDMDHEISILVYRHEVPLGNARGMAVTKYEDFMVAIYKLLETCSDEAKYAFLPKDNGMYKEDVCGGFRT